ncbi:hypothetical protein [Sporosarcina sp. BI001-red]|uniref:hypothetical protein n=1 Tax=Sporosarcina sp. BI001-red TaxID=2282866 RepID=UPI0011C067BB|nr:hypothetical protein [Sporosarcina sp. BI001-red]
MNELNLIQHNNEVMSNYDVKQHEISFVLYLSPEEQVCIIGKLDNNYICWCSITPISDHETNASIFEYVTHQKDKIISNVHKALGSNYSEVNSWHKLHINKRRFKGEDLYYSPVSSSFFKESKFFASQIQRFYKQEKMKCDVRLIDDFYLVILEKYKVLLNKRDQDPSYYIEMQPIIQIIEDESYLKLCTTSRIRKLYVECVNSCTNIYNTYMTSVR